MDDDKCGGFMKVAVHGRIAGFASGASAIVVAGVVTASMVLASPASAAPRQPAVANAPAASCTRTGVPAAPAPAAYTRPTRMLSLGAHGVDVYNLQVRLWSLKYYAGALNGVFGTGTQEA